LRENLERDAFLLHGVDSTVCAGRVWSLNFSWLPCLHSSDFFPSPSPLSFQFLGSLSFFLFSACASFQMAKNKRKVAATVTRGKAILHDPVHLPLFFPPCPHQWPVLCVLMFFDTTKELMFSPKYRSVEVINNPTRPGLNYMEVNCINYK